MSNVSRGKEFENLIREAFDCCPDCTIDRLHDQTTGFSGSINPCDFIAYSYPNILYLECKSCYGNTLSLKNITDGQWRGLLKRSKVPGTISGVLVWFIDHDETAFIPIQEFERMKALGFKSLNITDILQNKVDYVLVPGKKKRVFFEYDAYTFLKEVKEYYGNR